VAKANANLAQANDTPLATNVCIRTPAAVVSVSKVMVPDASPKEETKAQAGAVAPEL